MISQKAAPERFAATASDLSLGPAGAAIFHVWMVPLQAKSPATQNVSTGGAAPTASPFASLPPFASLRAFDAVGRVGGLRRAAQSLGIDHAAVSRHLSALEEWLGVVLVDRRRSGGQLTEQGQRYHQRISLAFAQLDATVDDPAPRTKGASIKIWCNFGIASQWLSHRLGTFCILHPNIDVQLHPTVEPPDLLAREADADIRYLYGSAVPEEHFSGVRSLEIARPPNCAVASPALLAKHRKISAAEDLLRLPMLHGQDDGQWRSWLHLQGVQCPATLPGPRLGHPDVALAAARKHLGVALSNTLLVSEHIQAGRLVEIGIGKEVSLGAYHFITQSSRWSETNLSSLREWIQNSLNMSDRAP